MPAEPTIVQARPGETENLTISGHNTDCSAATVSVFAVSGSGVRTLLGSDTGAAIGTPFDVPVSYPDIDDAVYDLEVLINVDEVDERNILSSRWLLRMINGRAS